jgi:hypothetical protein
MVEVVHIDVTKCVALNSTCIYVFRRDLSKMISFLVVQMTQLIMELPQLIFVSIVYFHLSINCFLYTLYIKQVFFIEKKAKDIWSLRAAGHGKCS